MNQFTLTSPLGTKGFTGKTYREILSCELGENTAKIYQICLSGRGVTGWRVSGFDSTVEFPPSPKQHTLDLGDYSSWDGNLKIEANAGQDRVFPYAEIKGEQE